MEFEVEEAEKKKCEWKSGMGSVVECGKVKNSGERSAIEGEETESTYSPLYLLHPVGDSFL